MKVLQLIFIGFINASSGVNTENRRVLFGSQYRSFCEETW